MMTAMALLPLMLLEILEHVNSLLKPLVTMDSIMIKMVLLIVMILIASMILPVQALKRFVMMV